MFNFDYNNILLKWEGYFLSMKYLIFPVRTHIHAALLTNCLLKLSSDVLLY